MKKEIVVLPRVGIEVDGKRILFGSDSNSIHKLIGIPSKRFARLDGVLGGIEYDGLEETEIYPFMHVIYDKSDHCVAIEVFEPVSPVFQGMYLIGKSFSDALDIFRSKGDNNLEIEYAGVTSYQFGIGLYTEDAEENTKIESMIVFQDGYYDQDMDELGDRLFEKYRTK